MQERPMDFPSTSLQSAPATLRNREPILRVLRPELPDQGLILEIASGTGEHVTWFAKALPSLQWQPSDPDPASRDSITAWTATRDVANVRTPLDIDVRVRPWPITGIAAILCINMVHISPWPATEALMAEASRLLPPNGLLYLYGPYLRPGMATAPSNIAFDGDLRQRNPEWGLRNLRAVEKLAAACRLTMQEVVPMPANNLSIILRRR
jgi:SAM-dependent methyltransferase